MEFQWRWNDINGPRSTLGFEFARGLSFRASSAQIGVKAAAAAASDCNIWREHLPSQSVEMKKEPRQNKKTLLFFFWREKKQHYQLISTPFSLFFC